MAEATQEAAEAATHHIPAEAEALAEEDIHRAEVSAAVQDRRAEAIIIAEGAEDALTADRHQDTADITEHRHHLHHTEAADITDVRQEEAQDAP